MSFHRKKDEKKKKESKTINFEDALKSGLNMHIFKPSSISELAEAKKSQVWEIKLKDEEETVFGIVTGLAGDTNIYFDEILNIDEVDEFKKIPKINQIIIRSTDIEGVRLTEIEL